MKKMFTIILLILFTNLYAMSDFDDNASILSQKKDAIKKMNLYLTKIIKKREKDKKYIQKFLYAQKKWEEFKEAQLNSIYCDELSHNMYMTCYNFFDLNLIENRTNFLISVYKESNEEYVMCKY